MDKILENYAPGFDQLSEDERQTIHCFSLLWTVFEAQVLESNASVTKIMETTRLLEEGGKLEDPWFSDTLVYFINRYINKNTCDTNDKFASLNLRNNDDKELVTSVLKKEIHKYSAQLAACLIIVFRFRNNYFHGLKWADEMTGQKDNFDHSIQLMTSCIDRFRSI